MIYFTLLSIIYKLSPRPYPPPPTCPSQCHSSRWCSFHPLHTIYSTSRSMNTVLWGNKKSPRNVTLRMELPDMIQVPSRSSVALEWCLYLHDVKQMQYNFPGHDGSLEFEKTCWGRDFLACLGHTGWHPSRSSRSKSWSSCQCEPRCNIFLQLSVSLSN